MWNEIFMWDITGTFFFKALGFQCWFISVVYDWRGSWKILDSAYGIFSNCSCWRLVHNYCLCWFFWISSWLFSWLFCETNEFANWLRLASPIDFTYFLILFIAIICAFWFHHKDDMEHKNCSALGALTCSLIYSWLHHK